ncbi:nickel ABC transporter substrate-binding protein [Malaciobacter mytili]|uniref:nickel ABC transporter substrate-binding protein n=1 Tax=Malaciobacter mytili TaxID=603050 RepID=UPI003BB0BCD8
MKKSIFFINIIVLIISILFFSGCTNQDIKKDELVYASTKDIRNINPHLYSGEMAAQNMVFEPLVLNTNKGIQPWLAKEWQISNNGKTYTFYLREDVLFSNGEVFNAQVVKENIDAILRNKTRHAWLELINVIDSTEVIDTFTFKLNLKNAYYPTLTELSMTRPFRFLAPQCFVNNETKNSISCYVGTGPWVLKEHKKNAFARFERNLKYWNEKTKISSVKWRVMPDHQAILLALQKGEIDLIFGADGDMIDINAFSMLEKQNKFATKLSNPIASRAILLNTNKEFTKDLKIREALQYAIDKQAIVSGILNNTETVATRLFSTSIPYCNINLENKEFNITKAKEILKNIGWQLNEKTNFLQKDGKTLSLKLYYNISNAQEKMISEYIQSNLKTLGVDLKIIGEEKQAFLNRQKSGDFDLQYSLSWGLPYDPQSFVSSWRLPTHGDYQAQYGLEKKAWLDKEIKAILIEENKQVRQKKYKEILEYIHNQSVYIPLSYSRTKAVHKTTLEGVTFNPSQYEIAFEKMYFKK